MALGRARIQQGFQDPRDILGDRLREGSLYRLLADHGQAMFPDGYFADLYSVSAKGQPTIPARLVATVMLLQAFEGLSDREACDRLEADLRWQAAAGVDAGHRAFHPTVLVGMRSKLRASARPRRLFEDTKVAARATGAMKGRARVLDATAVYDAVATQDTVTQLRAAIRKTLAVLDKAGSPLAAAVRQVLRRDDDYASAGKPPCDWDDPAARETLVDELVKDALAALAALDGHELGAAAEAADLLALVSGQDVGPGDDGVFRIARKTAADRVISTVDTQARHGHKSRNRRFDGYKAHLSIDPDSELIDEVAATAANTPDRDAAARLLDELAAGEEKPEVIGDSAYGDAATRAALEEQGFTVIAKCPPARNSGGRFAKDQFTISLEHGTVTCPAGQTAVIAPASGGGGRASFRPWCAACPLRPACTASRRGRTIAIHPREDVLQRARQQQRDPAWQDQYRTDRPIVERKISHFTRRAWGGRKARTRGLARIATDLDTRASALNWARLAILGLHRDQAGWALTAT
ncbi:MAG: IS1182 family transposase [Streptosporangiaceae bacterium]